METVRARIDGRTPAVRDKTRTERVVRMIPFLLFATAILLYVPGIWWGVPHAAAPDRIYAWGSDELAPIGPVAELYSVFVADDATFNPQYPLLQYVFQAAFVGPYLAYLWLRGEFGPPSTEYPFGLADPVSALRTVTLLARTASLLMAAGTVVAAYQTAKMLWDRYTGLIAGVLVLLSYPMFYYGRTSNVDMGALFWTSLGIVVFVRILQTDLTARRAVLLGLFAALATATKDASYAAFVMIGLVLVPVYLRRHARSGGWRTIRELGLVVIVGLLSYLVASGALFSPERYRAHLEFITQGSGAGRGVFYYSTPATVSGYLTLFFEAVMLIVDGLGVPVALLCVAGITICLWRDRRALFLLLPAVGVFLLVIMPVRFVLFRFIMIPAYLLALFAARALAISIRAPSPALSRLGLVFLVVAAGWSLLRGADLTYQMINDSRYELADWFRMYGESGDSVGYYGAPLKLPALDAGITTAPMPGQPAYMDGFEAVDLEPEFVLVIPQQPFEPVHEWTLPEETYQAFREGKSGYHHILTIHTRSLFSRRPITFVNPPVQLFARDDRARALTTGGLRIDP